MTWTYGGDPSANSRDMVRLLIGDTDETAQLFSDEEIAAVLAVLPNPLLAAARLARAAAGKFARRVDHSGEGLSRSASQMHKHYMDLAKQLEDQARRDDPSLRVAIAGIGAHTQPEHIYTTTDLVSEDSLRPGPESVSSPVDS